MEPQVKQKYRKGIGKQAAIGKNGQNPFFTPTFIQAKLRVNAPNDVYEKEADAVADKVMRMPDNAAPIQRKCKHCEPALPAGREEEKMQRKPIANGISSVIQRSGKGGGNVSPQTASSLQSSKGQGNPLPNETRSFMESRFGTDFGNVNIHTDTKAVQLSRDLNAQAFTHGSDIYFNEGKFAPESSVGKRLLAHELTHVVQQDGLVGQKVQRRVDNVEVNCADDQIRFLHDGTVTSYPLNHCDVTDNTYNAAVILGQNRVDFDLGEVPQDTRFDFNYSISPGQPSPNTFFDGQERVNITCSNTPGSGLGIANVHFNARLISAEDLFALTGQSIDRIPEGIMVPVTNIVNDAVPSVIGPTGAAASYFSPTPWSFIPRDTTGILWVQGHTSVWSNPEGAFSPTIRGYRGNLGYYFGEMMPFLGRSFTMRLHEGVPGSFANDAWFPLMAGEQHYVFAPRSRTQAEAFAARLQGTQYGGDYTYSPPRSQPDPILGEVRPTERSLNAELTARGRAPMCTNNCITVPAAEIEAAIGTRPATRSGIDLISGTRPDGTVDPHYAGRGRLMTEAVAEGPLQEGASRLRLRVTPGASASMFVIRAGGRIMLVYGIYHTEERIRSSIGTGTTATVITEEAGAWTGGILGAALGGAAAGAIFCAPTGPVDAVCVVGGFLGGLLFGAIGGTVGHAAGHEVGETVVTPVIDRVTDELNQVERSWTRSIYNLYGVPYF